MKIARTNTNLALATYGTQFQKTKRDGKRRYKDLTYEYLCELIGLDNKEGDIGCSVRKAGGGVKFVSVRKFFGPNPDTPLLKSQKVHETAWDA